MKKQLFLMSAATLALTPAIVTQASEAPTDLDALTASLDLQSISENQMTTAYISPLHVENLAGDERSIAATLSRQYSATTGSEVSDAFYQGLADYADTIEISYTGSLTYQEIANHINETWENLSELNDYLSGQISKMSWSWSTSGNTKNVVIQMTYHSNHLEQQYITQQVKQIANDIIQPGMSDFEKVKAVNDYIVLNHSYNLKTKNSPHSVYTFLTEKQGVCQAYALLVQKLFDEIGIPSHYVRGDAGGLHAWNLVKVNGQWYHLDTTWNDPSFSKYDDSNKNYISYGYFFMSDEQIRKDHTVSKEEKNLPSATSTRYTAYHSISNPTQVGNLLYFANNNDDIKLYALDLNDVLPTVTKISDTRYQYPFYANGAIYFSNYSNGAYLAKLDLQTMQETIIKQEEITHIIRQGKDLVAYNNTKVVYREEIQETIPEVEENPPSEIEGIPQNIQSIIEQIDALDSSATTFLIDLLSVAELINVLTVEEISYITNNQKFVDFFDVAEQYLEEIDHIESYISKLNTETDILHLIDQTQAIRSLINNANPVVQSYISNIEHLEYIEHYILQFDSEAQEQEPAHIEQAHALLKDFQFLSKDFPTRAQAIIEFLASLGTDAEQLLAEDLFTPMQQIKQQYEKMRTLHFANSSPFAQPQTTTDATKHWTVALSAAPAKTAASLSKITVVDMFGDPVKAAITIRDKHIIVTPVEGYVADIPYTLVIDAGLQSVAGQTLAKGAHLEFRFVE